MFGVAMKQLEIGYLLIKTNLLNDGGAFGYTICKVIGTEIEFSLFACSCKKYDSANRTGTRIEEVYEIRIE